MVTALFISPELFDFLTELKANNNRPWFADNKHRYEDHIKKPLLMFIETFAPLLNQISPHARAEPKWGQSLFKIHRDIRFTKDKSPFKTFVGIRFRHESATEHFAPSFYLHLSPEECFAAGGIWKADTKTLTKIRNLIVDDPEEWTNLKKSLAESGFEMAHLGATLKRAPRGFDNKHPCVEDLKRKHYIISTPLTREEVLHPRFISNLAGIYQKGSPMMSFLAYAVDLPW